MYIATFLVVCVLFVLFWREARAEDPQRQRSQESRPVKVVEPETADAGILFVVGPKSDKPKVVIPFFRVPAGARFEFWIDDRTVMLRRTR